MEPPTYSDEFISCHFSQKGLEVTHDRKQVVNLLNQVEKQSCKIQLHANTVSKSGLQTEKRLLQYLVLIGSEKNGPCEILCEAMTHPDSTVLLHPRDAPLYCCIIEQKLNWINIKLPPGRNHWHRLI